MTSVRTAARPATSIPYALTCPALTSRKMSLCRKMMRLMNPRQCNRKVLLRIPVTPLIPHLGEQSATLPTADSYSFADGFETKIGRQNCRPIRMWTGGQSIFIPP